MDKMKLESTGPTSFTMEGKIDSVLQDFDQDEIDAFVLAYRQFTQNNDPISINSLGLIYARAWMPPGPRRNYEEIRACLNRELDAYSDLIFGNYRITVRALVEIVLYGDLAHAKSDKAEIVESWQKSGIMGCVWAEFFAAMRALMERLKQIRGLNEMMLAVANPYAPGGHSAGK
jgi:hypothetical protein